MVLKTKNIILIFLLFLLINPFVFSEDDRQNKNILILYALAPSRPAYKAISDGIRTKLTEAYGDDYNLRMEYLETERYPEGEYPKGKFELFNEKYKNIKLDLLILVGTDIIKPVKSFADSHLLNLPTIAIDYDFSLYGHPSDLSLNDHTTEIRIKVDVGKIISANLSLFPDTKLVYFICGESITDRFFCSISQEAVKTIAGDREISFLTEVSMDEVLEAVRHLPEHSIILVPYFNVDSKQVPYYNPEAIRLISMAANAPVFGYSDMGFGEGALGGYIFSFKEIGRLAGETAVKILNGTDPNSIIINESDYYEYLFDWRELKRWDLVNSPLIPEGSHIQFEEISFFNKYKLIIILTVLFLVLQSLLIFNLVRLNRKQKLVTRQLIETENKFRDLVREDRILRIGQLTASLSHELNQPLTAILSTAQAGIRFIDSNNANPELLKEIFQNIVEDDKRTASILSSIRGMMKLEKREKDKVNLNTLMEEIISIYHSEAIKKRIKLNVKLADQAVYILADQIQIQQVIMNFILNAMQSIEKINANNRLVIITERFDDEYVYVSVRDYGEGITDALKPKLFKPFVTSKKEGSGIGLAISRAIIDDHQGKIWAENMPDGGAAFSFSLKIYKDE